MSRLNLNETKPEVPAGEGNMLDILVPAYADHKKTLDEYKKTCDSENAQIKDEMFRQDVGEFSAGGYTAKRIVTTKESMDNDMLPQVLKKHKIPAVACVEVVDVDALEQYLYNNEISAELAEDIDRCRKTTEVVQLRISKTKKKKEEE